MALTAAGEHGPPELTRRRWRSRRSAAVAGIVFAVLLITAMTMMRMALAGGSYEDLQSDESRRTMIRLSLHLIPFAGIAFLWFIGVVRDQLGEIEDRLFSTVFLGSGLLFLAMVFIGAVISASLMTMLAGPHPDPGLWEYGRENTQVLVCVRDADGCGVHPVGEHRRPADRGLPAVGVLPRLPGRPGAAGGRRRAQVDPDGVPRLGPGAQRRDPVHQARRAGLTRIAQPSDVRRCSRPSSSSSRPQANSSPNA